MNFNYSIKLLDTIFLSFELLNTQFILVITIILGIISILLQLIIVKKKPRSYKLFLLKTGIVILLILAIFNPVLTIKSNAKQKHVSILIDVSDSITQNYHDVLKSTQESAKILHSYMKLDPFWKDIDFSVIFFGDTPYSLNKVSAKQLKNIVGFPDLGKLPIGNETNIEKGLVKIEKLLQSDKINTIILLSDGLETIGNTSIITKRLGAKGIPIHIIPHNSLSSGMGIISSYLPPFIDKGKQTWARLVLGNPEEKTVNFGISITNDKEYFSKNNITLNNKQRTAFKIPIVFNEIGIQHITANVTTTNNQKRAHRIFTNVITKPSILSISNNHAWSEALSKEDYQITKIGVNDIFYPEKYDVIVIDSLYAENFSPEVLSKLAHAVINKGVGFFLINGYHQRGLEELTVIGSFAKSELDNILPVSDKPLPIQQEPPPRRITFIIDTSGSMSGWPLDKAKRIAKILISKLNSKDIFSIISFSNNYKKLLPPTFANRKGKQSSYKILNHMSSGGGTNPSGVFQEIKGRGKGDCGLFFISDGEFSTTLRQPGCLTTVFMIGQTNTSVNQEVYKLGEVHLVGTQFNATKIKYQFFEPPTRNITFEREQFIPDNLLPTLHFIPKLSINGNAISYPKLNTQLVSVRPYPIDPVLAFMKNGIGMSGVFTSKIPLQWIEQPKGRAAINAWINHLLLWSERNRYQFQVNDFGDNLSITLTLMAKIGQKIDINSLSAYIEIPKETNYPIKFKVNNKMKGSFKGVISIPNKARGKIAYLVLRESGKDALPRSQSIPIKIPSYSSINIGKKNNEYWRTGVNQELLREIANETGGIYNPSPTTCITCSINNDHTSIVFWPGLLVFGAILYLFVITLEIFRW